MHSEKYPFRLFHVAVPAALIVLFLAVIHIIAGPASAADPASADSADTKPLILAVHPYLSHNELMERFTPLAEYLAGELEHPIVVRIGTDYREHIINIANGMVDVAYIGPTAYIKLVDRFGAHPLLAVIETNGTTDFTGMIAVRSDSPFSELSDLGGKEIAFVDPNSTMGYTVPMHMFLKVMKREDILRNSKFLGSHFNVALGVLAGDFAAGALKEEVFINFKDRGLVELERSPRIPEHLFIARKNLSPETVEALRSALLQVKKSESGRLAVSSIKRNVTGILPVEDSDYDGFREILRQVEETGNSNESD